MGTENLTIRELSIEAGKQNTTLDKVFAMPEQDSWLYSGLEPRSGESYVCSCYVVGAWKASGLFEGVNI